MKYKAGDKVRVRWDLEVDEKYGEIVFLASMGKGKIFDVLSVSESGVCELNDRSYYSSEMLRPAEFKIWCETEEEKQAVLEELEKEGYRWIDSNKKPTEYINDIISYTCPMGFYLREDRLSYVVSGFKDRSIDEFSPFEFTGIDFPEKIIITKTPTGATATYGDKTVTTEGDFEDASRQALAKVLCSFKVGDKVKLKRNGVVGEIIDISVETRVKFYTRKDIYDEWCLLSELEPYTEPEYNAKLFCIKSSSSGAFLHGHIYEIKNGKFDVKAKFDGDAPFKDICDVNERMSAQFMEVLED